jgi:chemotaxis protein CheC
MVATDYTELQLDALREAANIGSGNAATALSNLLGRPISISMPDARALPLAEAIDEVGDAGMLVTGVLIVVVGDLDAIVLLLFTPEEASALCELLGVEAESDWGASALGEVGNILGCSYINALATMTGMSVAPRPPETVSDMLGAIVSSALIAGLHSTDLAIMMDSKLDVDGTECGFGFLFVPAVDGVAQMLDRLGVG